MTNSTPSLPTSPAGDSQTLFAVLRAALVELYPEQHDTYVVLTDAGLNTSQIAFNPRAETNWHNILIEAIRQNRLPALLTVARQAYSDNPRLQAAHTQYLAFIQQGGTLTPPTQPLLDDQPKLADDTPAAGESPYKGLRYFAKGDADLFFGREELTARLVEHLRQQPFLAVVGASGSGKSSVVRVGVVPALQKGTALSDGTLPPKDSQQWPIHIMTPTAHPLEELAAKLTYASESVTATATLIDDLRQHPRSLHLFIRRTIASGNRLLLVVDQFEELFTLCRDQGERQAFVDNLLSAAVPDGVTSVIIALRADFYAHCFAFANLRSALESYQKTIGPLTPAELRRAIEEPARRNGWELEAGLVDLLLADVGDEPGALPLLSHALLETWQRRRHRTLTLAGYAGSGRVQGAIAHTAQRIYNDFTPAQQAIAKNIFLRLTELGEGSEDTRRRVQLVELVPSPTDKATIDAVLQTLADARLVTTAKEEVEVAHEALIRAWPTLRNWLADDREGLRIHRRLTEAAQEWQTNHNNPNDLYHGSRLSQAQEWAASPTANLNQLEQAFLQASQAEADVALQREVELAAEREANRQRELADQRRLAAEQKRRAQLFRNWSIIAGVLLLLAALAASISFYLNDQLSDRNRQLGDANHQLQISLAEAKRNAAVALSRQLAAQSTTELNNNDNELAILLAIESAKTTDTRESFAAIRTAIAAPWHSRIVLYGPTFSDFDSAIWSHDEGKLLTTGSGGSPRIWDVRVPDSHGKELVTLEGNIGPIRQAAWSQDDRRILTFSEDWEDLTFSQDRKARTVRVWDATTGKELIKIKGNNLAVWSHDGSKILTSGDDNTTRIWDATTGKELVKFVGQTNTLYSATWSQDDTKILTEGNPMVGIWDAATGKELVKFAKQTNRAYSVIWSHDESKLLVFNANHSVSIWDATTGKESVKFAGQTNTVYSATWSQDDTKILTVGDFTVRIWSAVTGEELIKLERSYAPVWSHDESKLLTSGDGGVHIWDVRVPDGRGEELLKFERDTGNVDSAVWSPDDSKILTRNNDRSIHLWDATTGRKLRQLEGRRGNFDRFFQLSMWNQDGSKILTSSGDGTIRIWNAQPPNGRGQELVEFEGDTSNIIDAVWSQAGNKILTSSGDGTIRIWDPATGEELAKVGGGNSAVWSQDASKILSIRGDNTARTWDIATGQELAELTGIGSAVWNKDESKILTTSCDEYESGYCTAGTARIWNATTGKQLVRFVGHTASIHSAVWSHDDSKILTGSDDKTARIWDAASGKELVKFEGHTDTVASAVWNQDESKILTLSRNFRFAGTELPTYDKATVRIWDAATGKELVRLTGKLEWVDSALWSPDESMILTADFLGPLGIRIWDAATGKALVTPRGYTPVVWSHDGNKILALSGYSTVGIWDVQMTAGRVQESVKLTGHTDRVNSAAWSQDDTKVLTSGADQTARIWDVATGDELVTLTGVNSAVWSPDESKIFTSGADGTIRLWYAHMADLLLAACTWTPRNFTQNEWDAYMKGDYAPTCPAAPIPPDVITAIQTQTNDQIRSGQVISATQRLEQLNGWLQTNGQFKSFGVDVAALVAEVAATATAEAPVATATPSQAISPLGASPFTPLPNSTPTPP